MNYIKMTIVMFIMALVFAMPMTVHAGDNNGDINYSAIFDNNRMNDDVWGQGYSARGGNNYIGQIYAQQGVDVVGIGSNFVRIRYYISAQLNHWDQIYIYNNNRRLVGTIIQFSGVHGDAHIEHIHNMFVKTTDAELVQQKNNLRHYSIGENTIGLSVIETDEFDNQSSTVTITAMHEDYREYVVGMLTGNN